MQPSDGRCTPAAAVKAAGELPGRPDPGTGGHRCGRPRYPCRRDQPCDQLHPSLRAGRLCPSHRTGPAGPEAAGTSVSFRLRRGLLLPPADRGIHRPEAGMHRPRRGSSDPGTQGSEDRRTAGGKTGGTKQKTEAGFRQPERLLAGDHDFLGLLCKMSLSFCLFSVINHRFRIAKVAFPRGCGLYLFMCPILKGED